MYFNKHFIFIGRSQDEFINTYTSMYNMNRYGKADNPDEVSCIICNSANIFDRDKLNEQLRHKVIQSIKSIPMNQTEVIIVRTKIFKDRMFNEFIKYLKDVPHVKAVRIHTLTKDDTHELLGCRHDTFVCVDDEYKEYYRLLEQYQSIFWRMHKYTHCRNMYDPKIVEKRELLDRQLALIGVRIKKVENAFNNLSKALQGAFANGRLHEGTK